jgi:hypothetical protein
MMPIKEEEIKKPNLTVEKMATPKVFLFMPVFHVSGAYHLSTRSPDIFNRRRPCRCLAPNRKNGTHTYIAVDVGAAVEGMICDAKLPNMVKKGKIMSRYHSELRNLKIIL